MKNAVHMPNRNEVVSQYMRANFSGKPGIVFHSPNHAGEERRLRIMNLIGIDLKDVGKFLSADFAVMTCEDPDALYRIGETVTDVLEWGGTSVWNGLGFAR